MTNVKPVIQHARKLIIIVALYKMMLMHAQNVIPHYIECFQERFVNALLVKQFNNNYFTKGWA